MSDPSYGDLNHLISGVMSGLTTCFRFPGQLNSDLRKLAASMVPFSRLNFLKVGFAPLTSVSGRASQEVTLSELTQQLLNSKNAMLTSDFHNGRVLTCLAIL